MFSLTNTVCFIQSDTKCVINAGFVSGKVKKEIQDMLWMCLAVEVQNNYILHSRSKTNSHYF